MGRTARVIISADDFGLAAFINHGILDCVHAGAVSSVSVCAAGPAVTDGLTELARSGCGIGVHLCLNDTRPLSRPEEVPSLVSSDGKFLPRSVTAARLFTGMIDAGQVYREWKRQIETLCEAGIRPDHMDTHNHLHLFPLFRDVMARLGSEFNITAARFLSPRYFPEESVSPTSLFKAALAARAVKSFRDPACFPFRHPDAVRGFFLYGRLTAPILSAWLSDLPDGQTTEVITHPGRLPAHPEMKALSWNYPWEQECRVVIETVKTLDLEKTLCSFADLPALST